MEQAIPFRFGKKTFRSFFQLRKEDTDFLYFFRISIGLFILIHFLSFLKDFRILYTSDLIIPQEIMDIQKPIFVPNLSSILHNIADLGLTYDQSINVFIYSYISLCLLLTIGLITRLSAVLLLILHLIMVKGAPIYSYGVDYFSSIALFYCVIFPVGSSRSVDNIIFNQKPGNPSPYRKILQLHLCIVYFGSGIEKLIGENWRNGESFWKSVHLPGFKPIIHIDYGFMAAYPILPFLFGWSIILIEVLYPLFIWRQPYKNLGLAIVCLMHLGILVSLGLYYFSALMIILNLTAFLNLKPTRS